MLFSENPNREAENFHVVYVEWKFFETQKLQIELISKKKFFVDSQECKITLALPLEEEEKNTPKQKAKLIARHSKSRR